ncbi:MAG: hypothetical protein ACUVRF_10370 [Desulfotomaculales bacterium]
MLTRRRRDFLLAVMRIYQETGLAVHYIAVAERLQVSKWTAYDMLRQLEKDGCLEVEYAVAQDRTPGRALVLFRPSARAYQLVGEGQAAKNEPWVNIRNRFLEIFERIKYHNRDQAIQQLLGELPSINVPILSGAYTIAILAAHANQPGGPGQKVVSDCIELAARPEQALSLFAGAVLSSMARVKETVYEQVASYVERFHRDILNFTIQEKMLLVNFLQHALERMSPKGGMSG